MELSRRLIPAVVALVMATAALAAALFVYSGHGALIERAIAEGRRTAELAARSIALVRDVPRAAEDLLGDQVVAQAALVSQLVALADSTKQPARVLGDRLKAVVESTALEEVIVTDSRGRVTLRVPTASDSASLQPYAGLLTGLPDVVIEPAHRLAANGPVVKAAGVAGADRPRAVIVAANAGTLETLARRTGVERVIDDLLATRAVEAVWLLAPDLRVLAHGAVAAAGGARPGIDAREQARARVTLESRLASATLDGEIVSASAPIMIDGDVFAVVLIRVPAGDLWPGWRVPAAVAVLSVLLILVAAVPPLVRRVRGLETPYGDLAAAAAALQAGRFNPFTLNDLCDRRDAPAAAARAFRAMAFSLETRNDALETELRTAQAAAERRPDGPGDAAEPEPSEP